MPLNPPSYIGQDVWYSPDVYVNQVPVALWQPPQNRIASEAILAKYLPSIEAEDLQFQSDPTQANNQAAAFSQQMVQKGLITQQEFDNMKNAAPNGSEASQAPASDRKTEITSNNTDGAEFQKSFPPTYRMGQNFSLGQLVSSAYGNPDHWYANELIGTRGTGGLSPGQLVANGKLLTANCLDAIKTQFPDMSVMSTIRAATNTSQHGKFQACDFTRTAGFRTNYDTAIWILNSKIPYDQLILEYGYGGSWVHISYANPPTKSGASKVLTAKIVGSGRTATTQTIAAGKIVNMDSQLLTRDR